MKAHAKPCTLRMHGLIRGNWRDLLRFSDGYCAASCARLFT